MKIYYFWDAYCGWTYGFNKIASQFMENHPEIEVEMISGGLFSLDNKTKLSDYKIAQEKNKDIENYYGVEFSDSYNRYFNDTSFVMDSLGPARAFEILEKYVENKNLVSLSYDVQKLFYLDGLDLSKATTYTKIIDEYKIDKKVLDEINESLSEKETIHKDFIKAYEMGISSYPTMVLEHNDKFYSLNGNARIAKDIEDNLNAILKIKNTK